MIVLAALPFVVTNRALVAPAVLKAALNQHDIASVAMDLNNEVFARVNSSANKDKLYSAFLDNEISDDIVSEYAHFVKYCSKKILEQRPSMIALSLFCLSCRPFCHWLCAELRQHTDVPIVLGGPGIINQQPWLYELSSTGLITDYIVGDGEVSFVEYALGRRQHAGINGTGWPQLSSFADCVIPDYTDYNFYGYAEPSIPVIDSRGCVQSCEFCNVIEAWQQFQYKSADNIFKEMLHQMALYNIYHFDFRSSISNGNLREFTKLIGMIAEYNANRFRSEQISWEGSFIVRASKREQLWQQMTQTNASLFLGVESLIDRVRKNLGKNFSNQDLAWTLEQIERYAIDAKLLLISAYPTETLQDWADTKQWLVDNQRYASVLREIQIAPAMIIPGTKLERKQRTYGIEIKNNSWVNRRENISIQQRQAYHRELVDLARNLGFQVSG